MTEQIATITSAIRTIRGQKVLLDADLARIYGVSTKALNQAVKRNLKRFPGDFIFQLTKEESEMDLRLRSQIVTLKSGRGQHRKFLPYAFTENGAIMAANVLNSPQAVRMSVFVVRAFVQMRELLGSTKELAKQLAALEKKLTERLNGHEARQTGVRFGLSGKLIKHWTTIKKRMMPSPDHTPFKKKTPMWPENTRLNVWSWAKLTKPYPQPSTR